MNTTFFFELPSKYKRTSNLGMTKFDYPEGDWMNIYVNMPLVYMYSRDLEHDISKIIEHELVEGLVSVMLRKSYLSIHSILYFMAGLSDDRIVWVDDVMEWLEVIKIEE